MYSRIDFLVPDRDDAYERMIDLAAQMEAEEHRGWIRRFQVEIQGRLWAPHNEAASAVDTIWRIFARTDSDLKVIPDASAPAKVRRLAGFRIFGPGLAAIGGTRGFIESVDHRGVLRGWVMDPHAGDDRPVIEIRVDGAHVGDARADTLRVDLLQKGIGDGEHGLEFTLPQSVLDGDFHDLDITRKSKGGTLQFGGGPKKRLQLPRYFSVAAPWRKAPSPVDRADSQRLGPFYAVRTRIIGGEGQSAIEDLKRIWDERPDLVFLDAGLREAAVMSGSVFKSFRERMSARQALWSRERICSLGAGCCKNAEMPWGPEQSLARCPQLTSRFNSKAFTKQYAEWIGIPVPRTLLVSSNYDEIRAFGFPDRFVIKPDVGSKKCTFIYSDGINLLDRKPVSLDDLFKSVEAYLKKTKNANFVVEELIPGSSESGFDTAQTKPLEYGFYVFGGKVRIVLVLDRNVFGSVLPDHFQQGHFAPNWVPAPQRLRKRAEYLSDFQRPKSLDAMMAIANRIGSDCKAYVRVDLYDTAEGIRLGEVTTYSEAGRGYTDVGDLTMSQLWEVFPDRDFALSEA